MNRITLSALAMIALGLGLIAVAGPLARAQERFAPGVGSDGSITVPAVDLRKDWAYLGTYAIAGESGSGDFHVVYTQPESVGFYRENGRFPDGAVLVKELFKTATADLTTGQASWAVEPAGWFVMVKDAKGRYAGNPLWGDGWGWALFEAGESRKTVTTDYQADCLGCHEPVRASDLVYVQGYPTLRRAGQ